MKTQIIGIIILIVFYSGINSAQTISGIVTDKETNIGLPFINIGLIGKEIGTVSDVNGNYTFTVPDTNNNDTIKFSCIGYESLVLPAKVFIQRYGAEKNNITLAKKNTELSEVVIKPRKLTHKILGNIPDSSNLKSFHSGSLNNNKLGSEVGVIMKARKGLNYLEDVNFSMCYNTFDSLTLRVNIYNLKNGLPDSNLLKKPIYMTTKLRSGTLTVDLKPYDIVMSEDFFVSLEWLNDLGKGDLSFYAIKRGKFRPRSRIRVASQGKWYIIPAEFAFYCNVQYERNSH